MWKEALFDIVNIFMSTFFSKLYFYENLLFNFDQWATPKQNFYHNGTHMTFILTFLNPLSEKYKNSYFIHPPWYIYISLLLCVLYSPIF